MKVDVLNIEGKSTGRKIDLPKSIFGIEPNDHAIYLAVKQFLAHGRQGTSKTKERGEIKGSTRKIKKQKGTGTARAGSIKNPLFRGGGRVFGPKPRNYDLKLNKKVKKLARASAYSTMASANNIIVVEDFTFDQPKTQEFVKVLENLELANNKTVFVTSDYDNNLVLSGRNIKSTGVVNAKDLNTYEIMNAQKLLLTEGSIEKIKETFA
jgi:large subunit ribosomal protein L4